MAENKQTKIKMHTHTHTRSNLLNHNERHVTVK